MTVAATRAIAALAVSEGRFAATRLRPGRATNGLVERATALLPCSAGRLPCQSDAGTHDRRPPCM